MPDYLAPMALVIAVMLLIPRTWMSGPKVKFGMIWILMGFTFLVVARYLNWRYTHTLPVEGTGFFEASFAWLLIFIESLVWIETSILFFTLARPLNNSKLADIGEENLKNLSPSDFPTVDVFIATYNEDKDVLEKTILGALSLNWPKDKITTYILDDGKRQWLKDYCAHKGIEYMTRSTNEHAKAGNINAAIARTTGDYFMVLDADFVPQQNFLFRAMGLFDDPKVGIVQIPHNFYNADPMQTNLRLRKLMPDDQRFFFENIMTGRDGWDAAFCCGSNSITRRTAINAIGGKLPTGSITEDMLLTLAMLRKKFVTRYLNERLAVGLAPETLDAMYVQRARWARGAVQMLYLKEGPLGPGLKLRHRIMFIPFSWFVQPLVVAMTILTPTICLWTGWSPLFSATNEDILSLQIPAIIATLLTLKLLAPDTFFPLAATVQSILQAPRILPTVLTTLFKPHGHAFKVTPKGKAAGTGTVDRLMVYTPILIIFITGLGLYLNTGIDTRIIQNPAQLPMLTFWSIFSMLVLSIVQAVAVTPKGETKEERFRVNLPATLGTRDNETLACRIETLSEHGARLLLQKKEDASHNIRWLWIDIPEVGKVGAYITDHKDTQIEVKFMTMRESHREALIEKLFTRNLDNATKVNRSIPLYLLSRIFQNTTTSVVKKDVPDDAPVWLQNTLKKDFL
jgi:cellulose synthase (UDP-forming)